MKLAPLTVEEIAVLHHSVIRLLIAKGIITKEEIIGDLARLRLDADLAFRLFALLNETPSR
jgi:hypothetical protein